MNDLILDADEALVRFNGNKSIYVKLLKRFIEINVKIKDNAENVVNSGNLKDIFIFFHSLKGGFGNLSAKKLYEKSVEMENYARNNDLISLKYELDSFYEKYDEFVNFVNDFCDIK
jgi:HPt (histidine-containing phosphotransfer) domain-containing protein